MPVLLRHSRHVYSCVLARTHTSMRVLLRHNSTERLVRDGQDDAQDGAGARGQNGHPGQAASTRTPPSHALPVAIRTRQTDASHPRCHAPPPCTHAVAPTPAAHPRRTSASRMQGTARVRTPSRARSALPLCVPFCFPSSLYSCVIVLQRPVQHLGDMLHLTRVLSVD